jgi:glycosyltransferase involved in cell wall biosynthesis
LSLSIIVPVYNEEKNIKKTIIKIDTILKKSDLKNYEIIIVDDGSTDHTNQTLKQSNINFNLIEHEQNMGYGASIKSGIKKSKYNVIAITDADCTYPVEKIPEMYKQIKDYDMVVGSRTGKSVKIPFIRKPAKWFIGKLANYLAGFKIPDINSGLRIFKKEHVLRFFKILPNGFSFTTTITLAMLTNDMQIKYIPINYMKRKGKSKIRPIRDTLNFIQLIIRTVMYFNPLRIFVPVSLILLLISLIVFIYSYLALPKILDTTVAILFISSIQILAIGMLADMINKRNN